MRVSSNVPPAYSTGSDAAHPVPPESRSANTSSAPRLSGTKNRQAGTSLKRFALMCLAMQGAIAAQNRMTQEDLEKILQLSFTPQPAGPSQCLPKNPNPAAALVPQDLPSNMLASYKTAAGSRQDASQLDIMNAVLADGQVDPARFRSAASTYTARKLHNALNAASFCGGKAKNVPDSLRNCYGETREIINDQDSPPKTRPATTEEAAQINTARLAFADIFGPYLTNLPNKQIVPIEIIENLQEWSANAGGITVRSHAPESLYRRHVYIEPDDNAEMNMARIMHELLHAHMHQYFGLAPSISRGYVLEAITEYLSTFEFTKNTEDTGYETDRRSHQFGSELAKTLGHMETGTQNEDTEAVGVEILKRAYLSGDVRSIEMIASAVPEVGKRLGIAVT